MKKTIDAGTDSGL
jgi:hypothetical protein